MDVDDRTSTLNAVLNALQKSPDTPWYLVALVKVALDLTQELNALQSLCQTQQQVLQDQHKALDQLRNKYSEVLYHLKTAKE